MVFTSCHVISQHVSVLPCLNIFSSLPCCISHVLPSTRLARLLVRKDPNCACHFGNSVCKSMGIQVVHGISWKLTASPCTVARRKVVTSVLKVMNLKTYLDHMLIHSTTVIIAGYLNITEFKVVYGPCPTT